MSILEARRLCCRRFFSSVQGELISLLQILYHLCLTPLFLLTLVLTVWYHRIPNLHDAAEVARKIKSPFAVIRNLSLFV